MSAAHQFDCPYCETVLNEGALSCRCCGRDLTPVLPLLRRIGSLETRLTALQEDFATRAVPVAALPEADAVLAADQPAAVPEAMDGRRRPAWLALGMGALLAGYWAIVIWLDLPLALLRLLSIAVPFAAGYGHAGRKGRLGWPDAAIAVLFAVAAVAAMNAILGWVDGIPLMPQGTAAWRETLFYALSIGASLYAGMLLRTSLLALEARGMTSLPHLRERLLAVNGKVPMDTLKAIELTVLMVGTALSAATALVAGLIGVSR